MDICPGAFYFSHFYFEQLKRWPDSMSYPRTVDGACPKVIAFHPSLANKILFTFKSNNCHAELIIVPVALKYSLSETQVDQAEGDRFICFIRSVLQCVLHDSGEPMDLLFLDMFKVDL